MKKFLIIIPLLIFNLFIKGQNKRGNHWYFGYEAGINFNGSFPVAETNGKMESIEGTCSISDTSGNVLFYSNGEKVWNKNHVVMPNGNNLSGNQSSNQSSIIILSPLNSSIYFLFTTDVITYGTRYSIIDMTLNGGLGDVTSAKNILLYNTGTEEIAATLHCNANDYWVVGRQSVQDSIKFYTYLVNGNGVNNPIISKFNLPNPLINTVGCLTFSQDGSLLCFTSLESKIYLFQFNKQTGHILFLDSISHKTNEHIYSNAFSPDGDKLYISSWTISGYSLLSQFNLSVQNIYASRVDIDSVDYSNGSPNGYGYIGQIRLAPDQRIYVSRWHQKQPYIINPNTYYSLDSVGVIHSPNQNGLLCNFQRNFLYLNHKPTELGLPNFVSNYTSLSKQVNDCSLGVFESTKTNAIKISPNPFSSQTTIRTNHYLNNATVKIINHVGELVLMKTNVVGEAIRIERAGLASGVYFIQIIDSDLSIFQDKLIVLDN